MVNIKVNILWIYVINEDNHVLFFTYHMVVQNGKSKEIKGTDLEAQEHTMQCSIRLY